MSMNVTQKLIQSHLLHGDIKLSEEIRIRISQTLSQYTTGTLVMLELEALGLDRSVVIDDPAHTVVDARALYCIFYCMSA
jgi:hypothetical protein